MTGHINSKAASLAYCLCDSSTSKFIAYSAPAASDDTNVVSISAWKLTKYTTYAGAYLPPGVITGSALSIHLAMIGGKPKYIRIKDDGAYRSFSESQYRDQGFSRCMSL